MIRLALLISLLAWPAWAQERRASHCIAVAQAAPGIEYIHKASWQTPPEPFNVRVHYLSHASFLVQTEDGLSAVTDFTGFVGNVDFIPDVVTMNNAHSTHWTANPDPAIGHVLEGWADEEGVPRAHYLDLGSMLVRNVPTDVRSWEGGRRVAGNSIFVFEAAGLCIGHLGHLHHIPTDMQFAALGRLDVVMAPVDGGYTMAQEDMIAVLKRLKSRIVLPMHWFTEGNLGRFLTGMEDEFDVIVSEESEIVVSLRSLPDAPTVIVLRPAWLRDTEGE